ncbi:hypothetical protein BLA29_011880, partial [Euroglyphus maynei]
MASIFYPAAIISLSNNKQPPKNVQFKCTEKNCPYGPSGSKIFKKEIFLQNHMKNIHGEKRLKCSKCDQKFGLEFLLKYHEKYCGQQLTCSTCLKCYEKPTSLWMHCKRLGHQLPDNENFKFRKPKSESCSNFILLPVITTTIIPET